MITPDWLSEDAIEDAVRFSIGDKKFQIPVTARPRKGARILFFLLRNQAFFFPVLILVPNKKD